MKESANKLYIGKAPTELVEQIQAERAARINRRRAELLEQLSKTDFKYYCSICLIIRDENEYLEEWLRWHIAQGVQHFYIYDHHSRQPVGDFVNSLGAGISEKVTVIEWTGKHKDAQPEAYNDCLQRFKTESRWIGFIDADEQVRLKTEQTLPEFLKEYEDFAGVFAAWLTYNANGQIKKTHGTLRERFTQVSRDDKWANNAGKVFVQPLLMREMVIHDGLPEDGFCVVNEHKKRLSPYALIDEQATADYICVDHYYTKSYEEWMQKIARGSGHAKYQRMYAEFFCVNPDMESCRENIKSKQQYE